MDQENQNTQAKPATQALSGFTLSESQLHFGEMKLECTAKRWGVTPLQAAKIMIDVECIKNAWNWVNMDTFLNEYIHQEPRPHLKGYLESLSERPETMTDENETN